MKLLFVAAACCLTSLAGAQSFYKTTPRTIPGNGQTLSDTLNITTLNPGTLNGSFGLDSITLKLNYNNDEDLLISLTAPDGQVLQLANNLGGSGNNFDNTRFTMSVTNLVNMAGSPFNGKMRPESWMGRVNNGQNGNGKWILKIKNTTTGNSTGALVKWGLHFDNTPAPPEFFTQSTLPIVVVNTDHVVIQHNTKNEVSGTMGIIHNAPQLNMTSDPFNAYNGNISIKVRGSSSADFPQKSYTLTTTLANGDDNDVALLGMSEGSKWVLYGAWNDKTLMRNILTYQLSNEMGAYAPRTRLCELVINGDYKGVYVLMEKIKRGDGRVEVEKLNAGTVSGEALTGGYIFQVDRGASPGNDCWQSDYPPCPSSTAKISFVYEYPADDKINAAQKSYIAGYVDSFETALLNEDLYDTVAGYRHYIDVPSFIDQSILQELGHNVDGYRLSSFLHKAKNNKLRAGPIWDFNLAFGNADYFNGSATDNYQWDMACPFNDNNLNPFWWRKFETDTAYMNEYKCRYTRFRQAALDTVRIDQIVDSFKNLLLVPQTRQYNRWPIMGVHLWPNEFVGNSWQEEINYLKSWIHTRVRWMDEQLYLPACATIPPPGPVTVQEPVKDEQIRIYPNPAVQELHIESSADMRLIRMYHVTGQLILEQPASGRQAMLSLGEKRLAAGLYTIVVHTDKGYLRGKVVVR